MSPAAKRREREEFDEARAFSWIVLSGALLVPAGGFAQSSAQISCVRGGLQRAVDLYIDAQTKGDTSGLPLATGLGYMENMARHRHQRRV